MDSQNMYEMKEFILANGMSQLPNSSLTNDLSPYDYFDGGLDVEVDPEFAEASGRRRRTRRKIKSAKKSNQIGKKRRIGDRIAERRSEKRTEKQQEISRQEKAIADVQKNAEADAQLLAKLTETPSKQAPLPVSTMSKNTKIALTIGGVAIGVFVGFLIYKKIKK